MVLDQRPSDAPISMAVLILLFLLSIELKAASVVALDSGDILPELMREIDNPKNESNLRIIFLIESVYTQE